MIGHEDDDLLEALAAVAGDEADDLDARWDALAAGELSADDAAALQALAAEDAEAADAWAAFAPRDEGLDARIAASILKQTTSQQRTTPSPDAPVVAITDAPSARRRGLWAVGAGLAIAAGLIVFALQAGSALPAYSLDNRAGEQAVRGDEHAEEAIYGPGSQIDVILRPANDVTVSVGVRVFNRTGDAITRLPTQPTQGATGVFRLRGLVDDLLPSSPGAHSLIFVISAPGALPETAEAVRAGLAEGAEDWQVLEHRYRRR